MIVIIIAAVTHQHIAAWDLVKKVVVTAVCHILPTADAVRLSTGSNAHQNLAAAARTEAGESFDETSMWKMRSTSADFDTLVTLGVETLRFTAPSAIVKAVTVMPIKRTLQAYRAPLPRYRHIQAAQMAVAGSREDILAKERALGLAVRVLGTVEITCTIVILCLDGGLHLCLPS